jgi:hypothetical protein
MATFYYVSTTTFQQLIIRGEWSGFADREIIVTYISAVARPKLSDQRYEHEQDACWF